MTDESYASGDLVTLRAASTWAWVDVVVCKRAGLSLRTDSGKTCVVDYSLISIAGAALLWRQP